MSEEKGKQKVSTEAYKGVRDFYPEEQVVEKYILKRMSEGAEAFGYQEYSASPLEPSELYTGKTSEEIVRNETYTFEDRGGRSVTLRPEMTPTVARMVAARRKALSFPVRLFSIPNVFRYERPQRGRLREHYQLNVDLFGVSSLDAELEIISLAHSLLRSFGLLNEQFEIKINDRRALNKSLDTLDITSEKKVEVIRLLDKRDKLDDFDTRLYELTGQEVDFDSVSSEAVEKLIEKLRLLGITNTVYDKTLARGFDYYTGIVFEIFDINPQNNRSLFGGGRYDNLLEMFDEEAVPAVGFGMGDVVIGDVLASYGLLPGDQAYTDAYVCITSREYSLYGHLTAQKVREENWRVTVDMRYDSIGEQMKRASKLGAKWCFIIGEDEVSRHSVTLKNLSTRDQVTCPLSDALELMSKL